VVGLWRLWRLRYVYGTFTVRLRCVYGALTVRLRYVYTQSQYDSPFFTVFRCYGTLCVTVCIWYIFHRISMLQYAQCYLTVAPCACCVNLYVCMYNVNTSSLSVFLSLYHFVSIFLSFLFLLSNKILLCLVRIRYVLHRISMLQYAQCYGTIMVRFYGNTMFYAST
jgi:hypothetical protein